MSDRDREKPSPREEDEKAEGEGLFFLDIGRALSREESYRRPPQTSGAEAGDPYSSGSEEEPYWFSTFLESSVRDHEVLERPGELHPLEGEGRAEPFAGGSAPDDDLLVTPIGARSLFEETGRALEAAFSSLKAGQPVEHAALEELAGQIVSNVVSLPADSYDLRSDLFPDTLYYRFLISYGKPYDIVEHSFQVALLSVVFARELGATNEGLARLCLAGLLHEVGMLFLPSEVWDHGRPLSKKEWATVRYHAELGRELVSKLGGSLAEAAAAVGQEHERADGSGYPLGLESPEIDGVAKVIGLVDVFDALTHGRPHRPPCTPHQALKIILTDMREAFDYDLLKAFLNLLTVFPLGSRVELTTGDKARVVRVDSRNPLRPMVEVVEDAEGRSLREPYLLELGSEAEVSVSSCLDGLYLPSEG